MKHIKKAINLAVVLILSSGPLAALDLKSKAMQMAGEIVANPAAFFYDFQQDIEATIPLPPGKSYGFQTGLFPTIIPLGYLNLSGKYRLHAEGRMAPGLPQVDLIGGYWDMLWAKVMANQSDDVDDAKFRGYYGGLILSSSLSPKIRTFWGLKISQLKTELNLNKTVDFIGVPVDSFKSGFRDTFFIAGIETPRTIDKNWSIQMNYGVNENILSVKTLWQGKYFDLGLNFFPEGVLVVHPVWNFHMNF